ncbi:MAG TPA: JAB domain-containing protein, partial [Terriglobales bacterium]|nr:JAB domain-containing protein [Terriglobales bacterium]
MTPQQELIVAQALSILYAELKTGGEALQSPQAVRDFLRLHLVREEREVFAVLFLNAAGRVIEYVPMFYGTLNETRVYPREIARAALRLNAAS